MSETNSTTGLALYDAARTALIEAKSIDEVKDIKDKHEALRHYAKQSKDIDMANWAAEIRIRAERRMGQMLKEQEMQKPGQYQQRSHDDTVAPTLADVGITKSMSSRAQKIADVPEGEFEEVISEHKEKAKELTSSAIQKLTLHKSREEKIEAIKESDTVLDSNLRFNVIYADPPWRYEHVKTESRAIENQYPTMSLDEIKELEIPSADNSVLFMWATSPKLAESIEVIESWGFTYRTCAVWDKQKIGMGYYFRQQHELLLVAAKGNLPVPEPSNRKSSVFSYPRGKHSAKPHEFYELIDEMYPEYASEKHRIELFCRTPQDNWSVWGNQSES